MVYYTLLLPATCFGYNYSSHLQGLVLFTEEGDTYNWQYREPTHVAGSNNVKYTINPNINY